MLSVKQGGINYHFSMIQPGIEPQVSQTIANTLLIRPMAREICMYNLQDVTQGQFLTRVKLV